MYRLAVCEDEETQRGELCAKCDGILSELKIEHEITPFASAEELEREILAGARFQLLCLDILMPGKSGMEFALQLRERDENIDILFITGSREYLLEGYDARPIQYLLKPVEDEKLRKALDTAWRRRQRPENVTLTVGGKTYVLPLDRILYVESVNHGCMFHMEGEDQFLWLSLGQAEKALPADAFARCHRSFIVNMDRIREMDSGRLFLTDGSRLDIGSRYAAAFKASFTRSLCRNR